MSIFLGFFVIMYSVCALGNIRQRETLRHSTIRPDYTKAYTVIKSKVHRLGWAVCCVVAAESAE